MVAKWKDELRAGSVVSSELALPNIRLVIHRYIDYSPEDLFVTAHGTGISKIPLGKVSIDDAKPLAIKTLRDFLTKNLAALPVEKSA